MSPVVLDLNAGSSLQASRPSGGVVVVFPDSRIRRDTLSDFALVARHTAKNGNIGTLTVTPVSWPAGRGGGNSLEYSLVGPDQNTRLRVVVPTMPLRDKRRCMLAEVTLEVGGRSPTGASDQTVKIHSGMARQLTSLLERRAKGCFQDLLKISQGVLGLFREGQLPTQNLEWRATERGPTGSPTTFTTSIRAQHPKGVADVKVVLERQPDGVCVLQVSHVGYHTLKDDAVSPAIPPPGLLQGDVVTGIWTAVLSRFSSAESAGAASAA